MGWGVSLALQDRAHATPQFSGAFLRIGLWVDGCGGDTMSVMRGIYGLNRSYGEAEMELEHGRSDPRYIRGIGVCSLSARRREKERYISDVLLMLPIDDGFTVRPLTKYYYILLFNTILPSSQINAKIIAKRQKLLIFQSQKKIVKLKETTPMPIVIIANEGTCPKGNQRPKQQKWEPQVFKSLDTPYHMCDNNNKDRWLSFQL